MGFSIGFEKTEFFFLLTKAQLFFKLFQALFGAHHQKKADSHVNSQIAVGRNLRKRHKLKDFK
jgi:hypothetical protein